MWIVIDYRCTSCGELTESLEKRSAIPPSIACSSPGCADAMAERTVSAPMPRVLTARVQAVTTAKGGPPPSPGYMDTQPLADGMGWRTWKKKRQAYRSDQRHAQIKRELG